jgi:hypothetical protein
MTLLDLFNFITQPNENNNFQFAAIPIPEFPNHRIAKDKYGNPILLITILINSGKLYVANSKFENISILYNVDCKISQNGKTIEEIFTAMCFIGDDILLRNYFIKLCSDLIENLGNRPTFENVRKEINYFTDLLRLAAQPQIKTVQGLWAELFLILESKNPTNLLRSWHALNEEKFDFNNGEERIEVKSSANELRIHNFSIEQLNSPTNTNTLIASVFVKHASNGKNISDLQSAISKRIITEIKLIEKLEYQIALALGKSINMSTKFKFDLFVAKDSLRFYNTDDIPKISINNIPPFVTDIHFRSDLSDTNSIDINIIPNKQLLFNSI